MTSTQLDMTETEDIRTRVRQLDFANVRELRDIAGSYGLLRRGPKGDVIARIVAHEKNQATALRLRRESEQRDLDLYGTDEFAQLKRFARNVEGFLQDFPSRRRRWLRDAEYGISSMVGDANTLIKAEVLYNLSTQVLMSAAFDPERNYYRTNHKETFGWEAVKKFMRDDVLDRIMTGSAFNRRSTSAYSRAINESTLDAYREFYQAFSRDW